MRDYGTAMLLALGGFVGFAGLHRFYMGKYVTGVLWFLTVGFFHIGTILDLINMRSLVAESNRHALPGGPHAALPGAYPQAASPYPAAPYPGAPYPGGQAPRPAPPQVDLKDASVDLELRVLQLARLQAGRVTTPLAATELAVPIADAEAKLSELAAAGHANVEISDDGVVIFDFPALRIG